MIETKIVKSDDVAEPKGRRSFDRDSLFLSATIAKVGNVAADLAPVRVRNLSAIGLMADYSEAIGEGDPVVVKMRGIGAVTGKVAWVKRGRIGINFDTEVDPMKARKPVVKQASSTVARPL